MRGWSMGLAAAGGLFGAAGVALAAAGAHSGAGPLAATAATFLLVHAGAILSLCALARPDGDAALRATASLLAVGVFLFSGELAAHALLGVQPLPIAAPTGGLLMIAGWLASAVALPLTLHRRG